MVTQTKKPPLTVSNPWWGHDPSDKQWLGLYAYEECPDLFYGGAAGPGKTSFLLMAAVQYVHYPHYRALILRKTYAEEFPLVVPGPVVPSRDRGPLTHRGRRRGRTASHAVA